MSIIIFLVLGIVAFFIITYTSLKLSEKKTLRIFKNDFIGWNKGSIISSLSKKDMIIAEQTIDNIDYLATICHIRFTLKIFEFKNGICRSFFVQTVDVAKGFPYEFNFGKNFIIIDNDNFEQGIDTSVLFSESRPSFFQNGLTVEITPKRYAKIFRCINYKYTTGIKYKPLHIYVVSTSVPNIEHFIEFIKDDGLNVLDTFDTSVIGW